LIGEVALAEEVLSFTSKYSLEDSIDSLFANGDAFGQST
jgi:hypothetical protein